MHVDEFGGPTDARSAAKSHHRSSHPIESARYGRAAPVRRAAAALKQTKPSTPSIPPRSSGWWTGPSHCSSSEWNSRFFIRNHPDLFIGDALASRWHPKTVASARLIPFDLSLRLELCVERSANRYDAFPRLRSTTNRRVQTAADKADLPGRVYPHCQRATAASYHAYKGVAPVPLQASMGWSDLATAQKYIRISGTATADALRRVHHR